MAEFRVKVLCVGMHLQTVFGGDGGGESEGKAD